MSSACKLLEEGEDNAFLVTVKDNFEQLLENASRLLDKDDFSKSLVTRTLDELDYELRGRARIEEDEFPLHVDEHEASIKLLQEACGR